MHDRFSPSGTTHLPVLVSWDPEAERLYQVTSVATFFFLFNDRYSGIFLNAFYFIIFRWSPQNFAFKQQKKFFFVQLFFSPLAPYALLWSAFLSLGSQLFSFVASVTPENLYRLKLIFTTKPQLLLNIQRCNWKKPFLLLQLFEQLLACETFQSCLSF